MTARQKEALDMLRQCGGEGLVSASGSAVLDGEAFIDYRTADALEIKGLIERVPDTLSNHIRLVSSELPQEESA